MRSDTRRALEAYKVFYASVAGLRAAFPPDVVAYVDVLLDVLHDELVVQLRPSTMEDVRLLPRGLRAAAIIALIDRAGIADYHDELLDWYRFQIESRPDLVRRLLSASEVQTPAAVLAWLDHHAADLDEDLRP